MRRNQQANRRFGHRRRNAAMCVRPIDRARNVCIRDEVAEPQLRNCFPCITLQRRAVKAKGQIELSEATIEIGFDLRSGFP